MSEVILEAAFENSREIIYSELSKLRSDIEAAITATHAELQDQIKHANGEIAALKDEFEEFKKIPTWEPYVSAEKTTKPSIPSIKTYTAHLETENAELRAKLDEANKQLLRDSAEAVRSADELDSANNTIASFETRLIEAVNTINALESSLEVARSLDRDIASLLLQNAELRSELDELRARNEKLGDTLATERKEKNAEYALRAAVSAEIENLDMKNSKLESELDSANKTITSIEAHLVASREVSREKQVELNGCEQCLSKANDRIKALEGTVESARGVIAELQTKLNETVATEPDTLKLELGLCQRGRRHAEEKVEELRRELNNSLLTSTELNVQLAKRNLEFDNCKVDLHNANGLVKSLEDTLAASRAENAQLRDIEEQLANGKEVLKALTTDLEDSRGIIKAFEAALEASRAENAKLRGITPKTKSELSVGDSVLYEAVGLIFTVGAIRQGTAFEGSEIECHYLANGELQRTWLSSALLKKIPNASVGQNVLSTMKIADKNSGTLTAHYDGAIVDISFSKSIIGDLGNRSLYLTLSKGKTL